MKKLSAFYNGQKVEIVFENNMAVNDGGYK